MASSVRESALPGVDARPDDMDAEFDRVVARWSRRGLLGGLGVTVAVPGLVGCGSSDNSPDKKVAKTSASRIAPTIHGDIEVPTNPARIVSLNFPEGCALLDLGITPVGRPNYMPAFGAYTAALNGVAKLLTSTDIR